MAALTSNLRKSGGDLLQFRPLISVPPFPLIVCCILQFVLQRRMKSFLKMNGRKDLEKETISSQHLLLFLSLKSVKSALEKGVTAPATPPS